MLGSHESTQDLFSRWKKGDADAGQDMAQRFSDWYFAVSAARHGEVRSRPALERACQLFAQGIAQVTNESELEEWAHGILGEELAQLEDSKGVDEPSRLTGQRLPSRLLNRAVSEARCPLLPVLAMAYDSAVSTEALERACEEGGGYPLAILKARYELKEWLGSQEAIPFQIQPDEVVLDHLPLALYEAGRLEEAEAKSFERWFLNDVRLRKDVAEFSAFSQSLRTGVLAALVPKESAKSSSKSASRTEKVQLSYQVPQGDSWAPEPWMIVLGACALGIVAALLTLG